MNNQKPFNFDEFIETTDEIATEENQETIENADENENFATEDEEVALNVHKAVVEELAIEKVELNEKISEKDKEIANLQTTISTQSEQIANFEKMRENHEHEIADLKEKLAAAFREIDQKKNDISTILAKESDTQERNPNAIALLDREIELPDRFPGETRDHVLEVIREARDQAEKEGRLRRAQVLESVLVANDSNGLLERRRNEMLKLFNENGNILTGIVLNELKNRGISHKDGETFLLPSEIMKRNF